MIASSELAESGSDPGRIVGQDSIERGPIVRSFFFFFFSTAIRHDRRIRRQRPDVSADARGGPAMTSVTPLGQLKLTIDRHDARRERSENETLPTGNGMKLFPVDCFLKTKQANSGQLTARWRGLG